MAAETQPLILLRTAHPLRGLERHEVWAGPSPQRPFPRKLSSGVGLQVSHLGGSEHFRGGGHSPKNLV